MAFRRVVITGAKVKESEKDINHLIGIPKTKIDFPDLKFSVKTGAKSDTLVVDINGDGADSFSKKVKDMGVKHQNTVKIKNEKPMSVKEAKEKVRNLILKENTDSSFKIEPSLTAKLYKILLKDFPEIGKKYTGSAFFTYLNSNL